MYKTIIKGQMSEENIQSGGKSVHVVFIYLSWKKWVGGGRSKASSPHPNWSVYIEFEDDVTVIPLLGFSFMGRCLADFLTNGGGGWGALLYLRPYQMAGQPLFSLTARPHTFLSVPTSVCTWWHLRHVVTPLAKAKFYKKFRHFL